MLKLTDLDSILLSTASQRGSGSLLPVRDILRGPASRLTKAIAKLVKHGLLEERETNDAAEVHRTDGDYGYGLYITAAGAAAIGVSDDDVSDAAVEAAPPPPVEPDTPRTTKTSTVLALLGRDDGATVADLIAATGWLPHTTRAALTGLRKKGHAIERFKRAEQTCYRLGVAA